MEKEIVISVFCPICGHHLAGHGIVNGEMAQIMAYCPLCNESFTFENVEIKNI